MIASRNISYKARLIRNQRYNDLQGQTQRNYTQSLGILYGPPLPRVNIPTQVKLKMDD